MAGFSKAQHCFATECLCFNFGALSVDLLHYIRNNFCLSLILSSMAYQILWLLYGGEREAQVTYGKDHINMPSI